MEYKKCPDGHLVLLYKIVRSGRKDRWTNVESIEVEAIYDNKDIAEYASKTRPYATKFESNDWGELKIEQITAVVVRGQLFEVGTKIILDNITDDVKRYCALAKLSDEEKQLLGLQNN